MAGVGAVALLLAAAGCGGTESGQGSCAAGPQPPGVRATLTAEQAFAASDVNNLSRRFFAAGARCVAVGNPGGTTLEVSEQGITGARADLLMKPGRLVFVTWVKRDPAASSSAPFAVLDPRQVASADGGTCVGSSVTLECAPAGYVGVEAGVDSSAVTRVSFGTDRASRLPLLSVVLSETGTARLAAVTAPMPRQPTPLNQLALLVDDTMISNANVNQPLTNGIVQVGSGAFAAQPGYAADLVNLVNTGHVTPYRVTARSLL